jgi:hypothetical protein
MSKKQLAVVGGIAVIVGALTEYATSKKWRDAHTIATVLGGVVAIIGATS